MATNFELKDAKEIWAVQMYKNWGTIDNTDIRWGVDRRYYFAEKKESDFDLCDIEGLRKNAIKINKDGN